MDGVADLTPLLGQMSQMDRYLQPSPQELADERRLRLQMFLASLIGARKGEEWQRVGEGAMNALAMPGAQAQGREQARSARLQTLAQMMQLNAQLQQQQQAAQRTQIESGVPLDVGTPKPVQGPPEAFQAPGGAAALAGSAVGVPGAPPSTLPTLQQAPPGDLKSAMKQRYVELARNALSARPARPDLANEYMKAAAALEVAPEYYGAPEFVSKGGEQVALQMAKNAPPRELSGYAPPMKAREIHTPGGGLIIGDPNRMAGQTFAPQMTPAEAAAAAARQQELGISGANLGLARQRLGLEQQRLGMDQAASEAGKWQYDPARGVTVNALTGQAREITAGGKPIGPKPPEVAALRKEVNALQDVQNYRAALPMLNSARQAPNTRAGDIDIIYGVAKALDPTSVVREGELNLVVRSGTLPQQAQGMLSYVTGGGKLSPGQRSELIAMLENRVNQLRAAHDAAVRPFAVQADAAGIPREQWLIAPPATSSSAAPTGTAKHADPLGIR